ncbi:MAG: DUF3332 domain-containing protein [Muribaculaceae bacterium]|nr:DUF3332 domain-containing protein [Muribaculaceae bacterium]
MFKIKISVAALLLAGSSMLFTSCIGSFGLTNKLMGWNKHIGSKFVNELVFLAFWIVPVYEVTALADVLVINSIEFWSGTNPMTASVKAVDTDHGRYLIKPDAHGYTVTHQVSGESVRLDFNTETQTWTYSTPESEAVPFLEFVDDAHVRVPAADGNMMTVELSEAGLMAYRAEAGIIPLMAAR